MKKQRIIKFISAVLALCILASCAPQGANKVSSEQDEWILGEAYIPENNPEPVLVNREDACSPTPISYTDKIVGEEVDVDVKIHELNAQGNENWSNHIAVVSSHSELQAIYDQEYNQHFEDSDCYVNFYSDEFFEENVVVMLLAYDGSSAFRYKIDKVTLLDDRMYIYKNNVDLSKDNIHVLDTVYSRTFISIPQKDMENIKSIVIYEDELYCD